MNMDDLDITPFAIVAMVGDDVYAIFEQGVRIPLRVEKTFVIDSGGENKLRFILYKKDEQRLIRFAVVTVESISSLFNRTQLTLVFEIDENGLLFVTSSSGWAKVYPESSTRGIQPELFPERNKQKERMVFHRRIP